jgi:hypothetical protein
MLLETNELAIGSQARLILGLTDEGWETTRMSVMVPGAEVRATGEQFHHLVTE